ncbi:squalene/phytoene synthase family protein [Stakelama marina]|uniref:Squalene/phytoene synthase family protein n=1 Tax=Stakelama marina TaxID=2826939 RepID=A0A8T4IAV5_9SPHN|nr:squalene/phytoene synthase family protein [Stakelama marina]MBR0551511.1 squalene/phytoene synthase family protein [Stakelama marina]
MADVTANPERQLVMTYAPKDARRALSALLGLDDALAGVLRTTTEPALGQMRLVWWRDALTDLDEKPPPAMPVLEALAEHVLPCAISGEALSAMCDGWMLLIEEEQLNPETLARYAQSRGAVLFGAMAKSLAASDSAVASAGKGWALTDLAIHLRDADLASEAAAMARPLLAEAARQRWSKRGRAIGALVHLARFDSSVPRGEPIRPGSPARVSRLFWHRLTGR